MHLQGGGSSQFGRTLIVAGEGAEVTFFESCTSVARPGVALHCAVGEFVLGAHARLNYVALQNWQPNVFNLAILRARLAAGASVRWIDCNLGGRLTIIFYMRQRGLPEGASRSLSVNGFISDLVQRFPLQYSREIKKLIELEMSGSVG